MAIEPESRPISDVPTVDESILGQMKWRCIGPFRGGRCVAVAGDPSDQLVFYHGATAGGVWKTYDAGGYWENVSDGYFKVASVGAIAIADSNTNVVYVGTGEACLRSDVSHGDGVYKSEDGGKTWVNVGLVNTRHIARIRIHPQNPDIVYVAALGHAYGPNPERGVFRSKDGGNTWELVLFKSEQAGAIDISLDPNNPRILYAAIFQVLRRPWDMSSGGPDSGLYKSTNGGDTWTELSNNPGMPMGIKGRIGIAVSAANPERIWALIEAENGGLFRSDDGGATWELLNDNRDLLRRAWSYTHLFADPRDSETCWVLCYSVWKSTDGGRTFVDVPMPHGDHHDLWIDPSDPQRMIEGSDGGATVTLNGGVSWSSLHNQPTASLFHIATDNQFPYRIYSTQMDNTAISVPSRTHQAAIAASDCYPVGNAESGHIAVRPDDPHIVYAGAIGSSPGGGGNLLRYDQRTGHAKLITVWPENTDGSTPLDDKYRFAFTYPIALSPHDPGVLYCAGNMVFQSKDEGTSWDTISPDLTKIDAAKLEDWSGGPITTDGLMNNSYAGTIYSFAESPHERGVFWVGTDDGFIHVSRDSGATWENVTPDGLPDWFLVSTIEVSSHDPAAAYVAITRFNLDDFQPYLYKTSDYGRSWTKITNGIPDNDFTRVIREDPARRGLLYAGTETGVYVSFNDGTSWQSLCRNLPSVPVHDLAVKESDLVACTHGRSLWIMDDLTPLHQFTGEVVNSSIHLFKVRPTFRIMSGRTPRTTSQGRSYVRVSSDNVAFHERQTADGKTERIFLDAGINPPNGVVVNYYLKQKPNVDVTLTFLDAKGGLINSFLGTARAGMNSFVWDMRYPSERAAYDLIPLAEQTAIGAPLMAPPGTYWLHMAVGEQNQEESFEIRKDPRSSASQEGFNAQFELHMRIRDKLSETNEGINRLRDVLRQIERWESKREINIDVRATKKVVANLALIENELVRVHEPTAMKLPPTKLNVKLASLTYVVASADGFPTKQSYDVFTDLTSRIDEQLRRLQHVVDTDVSALKV